MLFEMVIPPAGLQIQSYSSVLQQGAQKCDHFWFIHVLSYRFNPIKSQLETVLDFWLVIVCMNECESIKEVKLLGSLLGKAWIF